MDHLIAVLLGSLLGWTATLFLEHRRWLPRRGDLISGSLGGLLGSLTATFTGVAVIGTVPTSAEALAALAGAGLAIALWRVGRGRVLRRTSNPSAVGGAVLQRSV
jgi:uncharacterized membrane protein YeaQ/YmgE (transglycosylase-associated protein family)